MLLHKYRTHYSLIQVALQWFLREVSKLLVNNSITVRCYLLIVGNKTLGTLPCDWIGRRLLRFNFKSPRATFNVRWAVFFNFVFFFIIYYTVNTFLWYTGTTRLDAYFLGSARRKERTILRLCAYFFLRYVLFSRQKNFSICMYTIFPVASVVQMSDDGKSM